MSLITPDGGLLFWMVVIFALLLLILKKWGFPIITSSIEKRSNRIAESLHKADEIELRFAGAAAEKEQIIADAKREQAKIMEEALASREQILKQAKEDAAEQTAQMLEKARIQIEADTKSALADMRQQVAMLSVDIAEKIIRTKLSTTEEQKLLIDKMVSEASRTTDKTS